MEFMEGQKNKEGLDFCSRLLWERGRNQRPTPVLPWTSNSRQDFLESSICYFYHVFPQLRPCQHTLPS